MYLCYVDESGRVEPEGSTSVATPVMAIVGVVIEHREIREFTSDFLRLKQTLYPRVISSSHHLLDSMMVEVKGTDLRRAMRESARRRNHAKGVLDRLMVILRQHRARLIGRVWVKSPGMRLDPSSTYTYAIQDIAQHFERLLSARKQTGLLICDARDHKQNRQVSHSIFTRKHGLKGDSYPHLVETPTFAVSDNHAGLQVADLVAGALVFPMACRVYCQGCTASIHMDPQYDVLRSRYAQQVGKLQYTWQDALGRSRGGIVVSDSRGRRGRAAIFLP